MGSARFTARFYVAAALCAVVAFLALLGPYLLTDNVPTDVVGGLYDEPSGDALLGTDNLGHDVLTNLMYGARTSLLVGLIAGAVATVVGVIIGTIAGYLGGAVEEGLMGLTNVILAIPPIIVLILISVALQTRSATGVALVIAVTSWPWMARAVRAQVSSVRTREHLDIARLSGAGPFSMIMYDVLPYMLSYIIMAFVLQVSGAILNEAALSLLGLGPSNGVSLGIMLHWALMWESVRTGAWWAFVPPTLLLTVIAFALLMLQSSLDEVFNPRLRRAGRIRRLRRGSSTGASVIDLNAEPAVALPGGAIAGTAMPGGAVPGAATSGGATQGTAIPGGAGPGATIPAGAGPAAPAAPTTEGGPR
ncbi:MAG TPA: ABC transporter permease [Micromonosporaceae bacterium]|nr:ABC transporter permease [Micromonosporaceae bacterium]